MDDLKFGTSGLRGLVSLLDGPPAFDWTFAFARMLLVGNLAASGSKVFVGRDLRSSSRSISRHVGNAISAAGLVPVDCGELPTPALAFHAMRQSAASIMVTGSHIPDDRNGLKFYLPSGEITKTDETAIAALHHESAPRHMNGMPEDFESARDEAVSAYLARYRGAFAGDALAGLTIGVYQHSSVARDLLPEMLEALGARTLLLGHSATFVPVDTEALREEDVALLRQWAIRHSLDAIVSTDGDADRPLIADETGRFVRGDLVGTLTAAHLGAQSVVTPVTSNSAIEATGLFADVRRTRVGSPFVIEAMKEREGGALVVGFEANGGVLLGGGTSDLSPLQTRDAFLPIISVLAHRKETGRPLSQIAASLGFRHMAADRLQRVDMACAAQFLARIATDPAFAGSIFSPLGGMAHLDLTDGMRVTLGNGGIVHFRASGNAPEVRCYVEAASDSETAELLEQGLTILAANTTVP
ncbi:MAG: phosphomannomutase [Nitratireductor sp.]|nr:phosphomannomutase [Nitratireductor sp.]